MLDREKVIKLIEEEISVCESVNQCYRTIDLPALRDILAVIKEQDQMYYTLEHDWRMCRELLKEQDAVKPKYNARTNWYECGNCHYSMTSGMHCRSELIPATKVRYCANCGFPVNWEGR